MDWDVLIPILMFAFPVAVAVLDKRAKKRRENTPPSYDAEGGTVSSGRLPQPTELQRAEENNSVSSVEGQRAISRERHREAVTEEKDPEPKLRIDKKNLILYSEILKPKFDA